MRSVRGKDRGEEEEKERERCICDDGEGGKQAAVSEG